MVLRHADPDRDAAACARIYAPYVTDTSISFEDVAPAAAEFAARIANVSRDYPWLVLDDDGPGGVAGFAYGSQHNTRAAYRWTANVAVYVDGAQRRRGAGRALYGALLELLARQGLRVACAGITLPNDASVGLHRALGFEPVGTYRRVGWKHGAWHDVQWWQVALGSGDGPPAEPLGPQRL